MLNKMFDIFSNFREENLIEDKKTGSKADRKK